jgi:hypothetical protein
MKRFVVVLLTALALAHCADSNEAKEKKSKLKPKPSSTTTTPKAKTEKKVVKAPAAPVFTGPRLEFLKSIPSSVDGCGEFFTYDTCNITDEKYIFLSDMGDMALIRVKGKDVQLRKNTRESKQLNAISSIEVYYAVGYKVILRKKEEKVVDSYYTYSGTLQIISKKIKTTFKVRGEGGC